MEKLPFHIQNKWVSTASKYKNENNVLFPPFHVWCNFIQETSVMLNDPALCISSFDSQIFDNNIQHSSTVKAYKTETDIMFVADSCPIHRNTVSHKLIDCITFMSRPLVDREKYLQDNNICPKCLNSVSHTMSECSETVKCSQCNSEDHPVALHYFQDHERLQHTSEQPVKDNGRERDHVSTSCTEICGQFAGKSCSKTVLVKVHPSGYPQHAKLIYAIIDDQSNRTLCRSSLFEMWDPNVYPVSIGEENYDLISCSGKSAQHGRTINGLTVSSLDNTYNLRLPSVLECDEIPNKRAEIPTPEIVQYHEHLKGIPIPALQPNADILMLIGRDLLEAHHIFDQRINPHISNAPFAQRIGLGWVIVGEVCKDVHRQTVNVKKTIVSPKPELVDSRPITSRILNSASEHQIIHKSTKKSTEYPSVVVLEDCVLENSLNLQEIIDEHENSSISNVITNGVVEERDRTDIEKMDNNEQQLLTNSEVKDVRNFRHCDLKDNDLDCKYPSRKVHSLSIENSKLCHLHNSNINFEIPVTSTVNANPINSVSSNSQSPNILSPSTLLTFKNNSPKVFSEILDVKHLYMYLVKWKRAQVLIVMFWLIWRKKFLSALQKRQTKLNFDVPNHEIGDVVFIKDVSVSRTIWP